MTSIRLPIAALLLVAAGCGKPGASDSQRFESLPPANAAPANRVALESRLRLLTDGLIRDRRALDEADTEVKRADLAFKKVILDRTRLSTQQWGVNGPDYGKEMLAAAKRFESVSWAALRPDERRKLLFDPSMADPAQRAADKARDASPAVAESKRQFPPLDYETPKRAAKARDAIAARITATEAEIRKIGDELK